MVYMSYGCAKLFARLQYPSGVRGRECECSALVLSRDCLTLCEWDAEKLSILTKLEVTR